MAAGLPEGAGRVLPTGISCSICREWDCQRRQCMEELLPDQVSAALLEGLTARLVRA